MLKRHLTLIIKVDNLLRTTRHARAGRQRDHSAFQYFAVRTAHKNPVAAFAEDFLF
jgi:hypothetical protein